MEGSRSHKISPTSSPRHIVAHQGEKGDGPGLSVGPLECQTLLVLHGALLTQKRQLLGGYQLLNDETKITTVLVPVDVPFRSKVRVKRFCLKHESFRMLFDSHNFSEHGIMCLFLVEWCIYQFA